METETRTNFDEACMATMDLWLQEWVEKDGQITVGAVIEQPEGRLSLWYRVPAELRPAITRSADPFLAATIFIAMHHGGRLTVHGDLSPSLMRNLEEFQGAWTAWRPKEYHPFEIVGERECEPGPAQTTAAVMPFSGGVDSCFTAWRHRAGLVERRRCDLRAGIFVHGFDIPLSKAADYEGASVGAKRLLASVGMDLIPMATNFRELPGEWEDVHGAALASCLLLLQGGYRTGLIAGSFGYTYLVFPYGSNPMTDRMFSSDSFPIYHDGADIHRFEKSRAILKWPEVDKHLRVCWQGEQLDRNCCRCQKCVSNMFYFRMLGAKRMQCFDRDISNREIVWMRYPTIEEIKSMKRILGVAKREGVKESWVTALRVSVLLNRLRMIARPRRALHRWKQAIVRRFGGRTASQPAADV
jgi:hypothetical protein